MRAMVSWLAFSPTAHARPSAVQVPSPAMAGPPLSGCSGAQAASSTTRDAMIGVRVDMAIPSGGESRSLGPAGAEGMHRARSARLRRTRFAAQDELAVAYAADRELVFADFREPV